MIGQKSALIHHGGSAKPGYSSKGGGSSEDIKVKMSAADTTADYLSQKIYPAFGDNFVQFDYVNPGGNESYSVAAGAQFSLIYNNYATGLTTGSMLYPPEYNHPSGTPSSGAFYSNCGFTIKKIAVLVHNFSSTGGDMFYIRLREGAADGSWSFPFSPGDGVIVGTVFYNVPNTGGASKYYFGGYDDISWNVTGDRSLFVYIQSENLDTFNGITLWLHCWKPFVF